MGGGVWIAGDRGQEPVDGQSEPEVPEREAEAADALRDPDRGT